VPDSPLLDAWERFASRPGHPFTVPGHKHRSGEVWPALGRVNAGDVPLFGGLASIKEAAAVLAEAEQAAAVRWGADWCRYSTGGSTQANLAVALAVGQPGGEVLVARNIHRSTLSGLILAGLTPVWLSPDVADGMIVGLGAATLAEAIDAHPRATALFLVEPSYIGTLSDVEGLIGVAHRHGLAAVVDQAWGAHFGFHDGLPRHALQLGADAMVTSAHKTLPAYSQGAMVLARLGRLDPDRLSRGFDAANTTSPAGSILASVDAAGALVASTAGHLLLSGLLARADRARARLRAAGFDVPGPDTHRMDPAKLVIRLPHGGGLRLEKALLERGFGPEQADEAAVIPMLTMLDRDDAVDALVDTVLSLGLATGTAGTGVPTGPVTLPPMRLAPRAAFFAGHETLPAAEAVGRVSAEIIAPYPPGVPVLVPGEEITAATVEALRKAHHAGLRIAYAADPTLATFQVVARDNQPRQSERL